MIKSTQLSRGWILYDGSCGFCSRWVRFWEPMLRRYGFAIAPLQEPWVSDRLKLTPGDALVDLRLHTLDGRIISGADVYLEAARHIWWAWPFYALFSLPGFRQLLHGGYRWFARNRYRFSHSCGLPPEIPSSAKLEADVSHSLKRN